MRRRWRRGGLRRRWARRRIDGRGMGCDAFLLCWLRGEGGVLEVKPCLRVEWLVDCLPATDHLSCTAARTGISLSSDYNTSRQQAHMSALTVALQQTPNGSAPILDTDHPHSNRNHIANVLAAAAATQSPTTHRSPTDQTNTLSNVHNPPPPISLLRPHLVSNILTSPKARNLLTCPDFSSDQASGPASIPHLHDLPCCTSKSDCPRCGTDEPDLRYKRMCQYRAAGIKFGRDAKWDGRGVGVEVVGCCAVM
jgi:hypothetical protein